MSGDTQGLGEEITSKLNTNSQKLAEFFDGRNPGTALTPQEMATLMELNARAWASEEIFRLLNDDLFNLNSPTQTESMINRLMKLSADWAGKRGTSLTSMWVLSETIHDLKDLHGKVV